VGYSEVWVLHEGLLGRILLKDEVRSGSKPVISALRAQGVDTLMLTGDRRAAAAQIAQQLGIAEVRAGLKPEEKVAVIQELSARGHLVAMVGDGVNDAPSLAVAHVSLAMGARGSDAALEQADVVLMQDKIEKILSALRISMQAGSIIRQNIVVSLGAVALMAVSALLGEVALTLGVLAHEGSTVAVCLNSLRLLFVKEPKFG
jgi:Cd2+/Zn2+-exporting ATPase